MKRLGVSLLTSTALASLPPNARAVTLAATATPAVGLSGFVMCTAGGVASLCYYAAGQSRPAVVPIGPSNLSGNRLTALGGVLLPAQGGTDIPTVPGLSQSTTIFAGTTAANGSGLVKLGTNDFQVGQGVLIPGMGTTPSFGAATIQSVTGVGSTSSDTATRCYVLVPLDGLQGLGAPSAEKCSPATVAASPGPGDYVDVAWTNGSNPPPSYALYAGPSGGPYSYVDRMANAGIGCPGTTITTPCHPDEGRAAHAAEFWLPTKILAGQGAQPGAIHSVVAAINQAGGAYVDVGFGILAPAGTAVTLYHDNILPIRTAVANEAAGACVRIPLGTYPLSATNFSGSGISSVGKCLVGSDRYGTRLLLMTGLVGAPLIAESGSGPSLQRLTIDGNGFDADANPMVAVNGAAAPYHDSFSLANVAKNAMTGSGNTNAMFYRFDATGAPDFANQSSFIHDVHSTATVATDFRLSGFGFDMADAGFEIGRGSIANFISAGIGTEIDPFAHDGRIHDVAFAPAATPTPDINKTLTECVEAWAPDDAVLDNTCANPIGSAYSIGSNRARVMGNTASSAAANPSAAYVLRMDSATYNARGAQVIGNTDTGAFTYGLGEVGSKATATGILIEAHGLSGITARLNTGSLQGGEAFVSTSGTPPQSSRRSTPAR